MFKLLRLEDRIVLDGAAMDAIHQKDQQDSHQYDLIMQAQGGHVSDHHLTPDAHQADIGAQDSGHDGTTDLDTHQPLFLADVTDAGQHDTGLHVLVISSNIQDPDTLAAAAKDDVLVIRYDANNTGVDDLAKMIHNALGGKKADSIAFATHDGNTDTAEIRLTSVDVTSQDTLLHDAKQQAFWKSVGSDLSDKGRIDLLACNVTADHAGEQFVTNLEGITGKHVAASSDITGNASFGGNWILETGNVDLKNVYFDDHKIDSYDGTLANGLNHYYQGNSAAGAFNILDNQSYTKGSYAFFTFNPDTFQNTLGNTVSYTVTGMPPGLSFNSTYRLFTGTPKAPLGKTLLPAYTITVFASDAFGGTDSLSFTMKIADTGHNVPKFASDPTAFLYIQEGASAGTLLSPNYGNAYVPKAVDPDPGTAGIINYRIVAPTNAAWTSNFAIGTDGTLSAANSNLTPGLYKMTVEAYDGKGYQDTSHITVSVTSKPKPVAWLEFSNPSFEEMGGIDILTVNLANTVGSETNVFLQFAGTATIGADYSVASTVITVPTGLTTASMTLTGKADLLPEGNETIIASIYSGGVRLDATAHPTQVTATIVDNTPPQVSLTLSANTFSEKGGSTVLTAALAGGATAAADLHVNLSFGGQATLNTDYTVTNSVITIPKGQASAAITVAALKDIPFDNGDETIIFTGTSTDAPLNPANSTLTATIKDFDFASQPTVTIDFARPYLYENETALLNVKLTNTAGITSPINVYYTFVSTGPLSATLGTDYNVTPSPQMVTINPMAGGADVVIVGVIDGTTQTTDLHIVAMIDAVKTVDANVGSPSTADILIKDYTVPTVHLSFAAGTTVLEGNIATVPINVTLDRPNPNNQVNVFLNQVNQGAIGYATAPNGGDYNLYYDGAGTTPVEIVSGQYMITFTPGVTAKSLYAKALTDVYIEGTENLIFNVATAGQFAYASADTVTLPIVDANTSGARISLTLPVATFAESGTANNTVLNVTMTEPIQGVVTAKLNYSGTGVLGTDYTVSGATVTADGKLTVTIPASSNLAEITLIGKTDSYLEPAEIASFTLESATNAAIVAPAVMTATLIDNFNVPTVTMAFGSTFHEYLTSNTTTLTVNLAGDPIQPGTTVNMSLTPQYPASYGYATPVADYALGGSAVWNTAGYYTVAVTSSNTTISIPVTGVSDLVVEPNETVSLFASFADGAIRANAVTSIINDNTGSGFNVWLGAIGSFSELGGSATMKVFMSTAVATDTTVSLAYGGAATPIASGNATPQQPTTWDYTVAGAKDGLGTLVTIPAGQTVATLTFTAISDGAATPYYEGSETLTVAVQPSPTNQYTVGASPLTSVVTGTITDEKVIPQVSLTYSPGKSASFPESMENGYVVNLTVPYPSQLQSTVYLSYATTGTNPAVQGTDYTAQTMGIINAGQTSANVPMGGKDDPLLEPNMTFKVAVSSVVSGGGATAGATPSSLIETVVDDDAARGAQVYILSPGFVGLNSSGQFSEGQNSTFTVGLDRSVANPATVNLQFGGAATYGSILGPDYTVGYSVGGTFQTAVVNASTGKTQLVFPAGDTRAKVTVYAKIDSYFEPSGEAVTVQVADPVAAGGAPIEVAKFMTSVPVYSATIMDANTSAPYVSISAPASFSENGGQALVAVKLDKIMAQAVTVNLAIQQPTVLPTEGSKPDADYGPDYGAANIAGFNFPNKYMIVTIPAGASQTLVTLQGQPDSLYERNEFVRLQVTDGADVGSKVQITTSDSKMATITEVESLAPPTASITWATGATATFGESIGATWNLTTGLNIKLSNASTIDTTVTLDMKGDPANWVQPRGFAQGGVDYSAAASSYFAGTSPLPFSGGEKQFVDVVIPANTQTMLLTLTGMTDTFTEGDEYLTPIVTTNASSLSPYSVDNTTAPLGKIKLIDSSFTAPSVSIVAIVAGTIVKEGYMAAYPVVQVDLSKDTPWTPTNGFVGNVTLTLGGNANWSAGGTGLNAQDYKVEVSYDGDVAPPTPLTLTEGKINLTFQKAGVTRGYVKFIGMEDTVYEPDFFENIIVGTTAEGLNNLLGTGSAGTLVMQDSLSKPTVTLAMTSATLNEDGLTGKTSTVSVNLSTPTSETLTLTVQIGSGGGTFGAYYDSAGVMGDVGFGTRDFTIKNTSGGALSLNNRFTTGNVDGTGGGGHWTATFTIPAGVTSYNLFNLATQDEGVYEGAENISITVNTIGGIIGAVNDPTGTFGVFSTSISGVTATIAESDTANKPYIKMAFDKTYHITDGTPYTNSYYFSEGSVTGSTDNTNTMKLSLFLTKSDYTTANSSASATTVLLTFDSNSTHKEYDNPPDGATPYEATWPTELQTWGGSAGMLHTYGAYGYSYDYTNPANANGGTVTLKGYSSGTSHTAPKAATYTMLVVMPPNVSQYDVIFTGIKDRVLEGEEKITVEIAQTAAGVYAVSGAFASSAFTSTATLLDADLDLGPNVSLSFVQPDFTEGSGPAQLMAYVSAGNKLVQDSTVYLTFGTAGSYINAYLASDGSMNAITSGGDYYVFGQPQAIQQPTSRDNSAYIVIPRGASTGMIQLNGAADGRFEGSEYVTASIFDKKGAFVSTVSTVSATLYDSDKAPTVTLGISSSNSPMQAITEGGGAAAGQSSTVTLYLSQSAATNVTSYLSFTNSGTAAQAGFATSGDFHMYSAGTSVSGGDVAGWSAPTPFVFTAGQTSLSLYFTADADAMGYEGNEKLVVTAVTAAGASAIPGVTATQTVTIIDRDHLDVTLSPVNGLATFGENDVVAYPFTIGLYGQSGGGLQSSPVVETITLTFTSGAAKSAGYTAPADYQVSVDQLTWLNVGTDGTLALTLPAGQSIHTAYLKGVNDNVFEGTESVRMGVVTASFQPSSSNVITATIVDDDPGAYVKLAYSGVIAESGGSALIRAMLVSSDGGVVGATANSPITVNLDFKAGDGVSKQATAGVDYTYDLSYLVIPVGYTEAVSPGNINAINDNNTYEGAETFTVGISGSVDGALKSSDANITFTIADDDPGPTVSLAINNLATFSEIGTGGTAISATLTLYLSQNANYAGNTSPTTEYVFLDIAGPASYGSTMEYSQGADFFLYDAVNNKTIGAEWNANGSKLGYKVSIPKGQAIATYYLQGVDDSQGAVASKPWHRYEGDEPLTISLGSQSTGTYYSNLQTNTSASIVTATVVDYDDLSLARTVSFNSTVGTIDEYNGTNGYSLNLQVAMGSYPVTVNFQVIPSYTAAASGQAMVASDGLANAKPEDFDVQVLYSAGAGAGYSAGLSFTGGATVIAGQTAGYFSLVIPEQTNAGVTQVAMKLGIFDDKMYEPYETFAINIVSVTGGVTGNVGINNYSALTGTIADNDTPVIKIEVDQAQPGMNDSRWPDWAAGHTVTAGGTASPVYVVPKDGNWNGHYYMATKDGITPATIGTSLTTGAAEPAWVIGGPVTDNNNIIWKDMGVLDQKWTPGMAVQTGTMIMPTDPKLNGHFYVATAVATATGTTGTTEPTWGAGSDKVEGAVASNITWKDMGRYNNYFVEGDAQSAGARYFKITKTVETTDGMTVDWYVNTSPTAGHAALASDYSSGSVISGTAILPAQAGSIVVPYDMTVTADNIAEANSNGYKDTDIVIGIKNVKYFSPPNGTFTEAALVAANNNPWTAGGDGTALPNFTVGNTGSGVYAEKYVSIYDDDFRPGDTGFTSANNPPVPLEPSMTFGKGFTDAGVNLTQGSYVAITWGNLYFKDIDQMSLGANVQNFDLLQYTVVTAPSNGKLFVDYNKNGVFDAGPETLLSANSKFYNASISGTGTYGQLAYQHDGGEQALLKDQFTFTVSDGENVSYATTGNTLNYATSGNPWVFSITAQDKNSPPDYDNKVFWVNENVTGSVYTTSTLGEKGYIATDGDSNIAVPPPIIYNEFYAGTTGYSEGGYSGSYIVKNAANEDTAGNQLFKLLQTPADGIGNSSGTKLALQVASTAGLDFEARDAYVLQVKLYDSTFTSGVGGTASGGYRDVYIQVKVNDMPDQGYAPIGTIPPVTLLSTKTLVYKIPDTLFPGATSVKVESAYAWPTEALNGKSVIGVEPAGWLHFESTSNSLWSMNFGTDLANRPTTSQDFVITVKATYYFENGVTKNPSTQVQASFTLHYSVASLDLDAVMDALQYLDTDGEQFLPVEGDQVPVQDMMMARSGAPADAAQEVSEVLAMLDAEAYAFDESRV